MKRLVMFLLSLIASNQLIHAQTLYTPVEVGSKVHFVIKNFGFRTGGDFTGLKGTVKFDATNPGVDAFDVTIDASTIDTDNGTRDGHLKQSEYFDVEKYKTIHFRSTQVTKGSAAGSFVMHGNLTIKNVTKPISFPFTASAKSGGYFFQGEFEINRRDYGVGGSSMTMGDNLTVTLSVMTKK